ncbi:hypothetical protein [Microbulbifer epialgicus]|uniref:Uncharacterized protein n=1 Tax=Microbulbifer epialgicus TaxID=393907 RepID=A0ABV4P4P4_9GAMM
MTTAKTYPLRGCEPKENTRVGGNPAVRSIYPGCATAILTTDDIMQIEIALERAQEESEHLEEEIEGAFEALRAAKSRMNELHGVLGAFDGNASGGLSKKERINWD